MRKFLKTNKQNIKEYILKEIPKHPKDVVSYCSNKLKIARQSIHHHLSKLIKEGKVIRTGSKKGVAYFLPGAKKISFSLPVSQDLEEDLVFERYINPKIMDFDNNIKSILAYGFTEMFNNVLDHSNAKSVKCRFEIVKGNLQIEIEDNGIGIFKKIHDALKFEDLRDATLELSKGKFTTDPERHTGEGIFFVSRIFDKFELKANNLIYTRFSEEDFSIETAPTNKGTSVVLTLSTSSKKRLEELFKKYSDVETFEFSKTDIAVKLVSKMDTDLISRSQAKRILSGLDKFKTITLDFKDVKKIGQAFVDEIFRIFVKNHPEIEIKYKNANGDVEYMIKRGLKNI